MYIKTMSYIYFCIYFEILTFLNPKFQFIPLRNHHTQQLEKCMDTTAHTQCQKVFLNSKR